jgi:hypothetical protein
VPASGDSEDDCGEADGMKIGKGNRSSPRKPAPALLLSTKSHMTRPKFEPGPPRWEAGDKPPELWRGLFKRVTGYSGSNMAVIIACLSG